MEKENISTPEVKSERDIFMEKVENAKPETILKIKEILKKPATWAGIFAVIAGSFVAKRVFGEHSTLAENIDSLPPETIKEILIAYRILAVSMIGMGASMITLGINKGIDSAKVEKVLEEENES